MKCDKKNIMKNVWGIRKANNVSMSTALKAARAIEKALVNAEEIGKDSGWNYRVNANVWSKYGKAALTSPLASTPTRGTSSASTSWAMLIT